MKVIVVGAGLARLTCVKVLTQRGRGVIVFEAPTAGRLAGAAVPEVPVGQVRVYYGTRGLGSGKKILLNAEDGGFVNNAV